MARRKPKKDAAGVAPDARSRKPAPSPPGAPAAPRSAAPAPAPDAGTPWPRFWVQALALATFSLALLAKEHALVPVELLPLADLLHLGTLGPARTDAIFGLAAAGGANP